MMAPDPYVCINCGHPAEQVYKTYAQGNLVKLLSCDSCGNVIDKYVEYDVIIILINLVLQNQLAYRHLLLNHPFQKFWKLGIVFLFCEAYCFWCFQKGLESETTSVDFYELELNFYRVLVRSLLGTVAFHITVLLCHLVIMMTLRSCQRHITIVPYMKSVATVWKGLCLCGYAEIFEMLALVFSYTQKHSRLVFVNGLFIISNINSLQVTTNMTRISCTIIVVLALASKYAVVSTYDHYFPI